MEKKIETTGAAVPRHVAVIMDGNGRWAKRRFLPRIEGHRAGARSVRTIIEESRALGIGWLTLYTFSLENWERPAREVAELMTMLNRHLLSERDTLLREGIRFRAMGELERLPPDVREVVARLESETSSLPHMTLTLALSYGGRQELDAAARRLSRELRSGGWRSAAGDGERFRECLLTAELPPVDMLVRTSGERRISNFLPWQLPGAYLHFTETLWPDFGRKQLRGAVEMWRADEAARGAGR
jgi:undecaprenyl diphosphate synthase